MRELARIQFRGDVKEFADLWNHLSSLKIEQRVIAIYKDTAEYERMRDLFSQFSQQHNMKRFERVEVEYSEEELRSFDILSWYVIGRYN